jgi:glutamate-1-semialdehyde 2,1-aminomutase
VYSHLNRQAAAVGGIVSDALSREGVPNRLQSAGNLFSIFFREGEVRSFADAADQDEAAFGRFFNVMLDEGVSLPPSAFEAWFVSAAHGDRELDQIEKAASKAARAAATG